MKIKISKSLALITALVTKPLAAIKEARTMSEDDEKEERDSSKMPQGQILSLNVSPYSKSCVNCANGTLMPEKKNEYPSPAFVCKKTIDIKDWQEEELLFDEEEVNFSKWICGEFRRRDQEIHLY